MADRIRKADYFKMESRNVPGEGAKVLEVLRDAKVNLLAFTGFPRGRKAQMDFIPENSALFVRAVKRAGYRVSAKKTVFLVQGGDRIGALQGVMEKLGQAAVNVIALDAVSGGKGHFGAMLWVKPTDVRRAAKALGVS